MLLYLALGVGIAIVGLWMVVGWVLRLAGPGPVVAEAAAVGIGFGALAVALGAITIWVECGGGGLWGRRRL